MLARRYLDRAIHWEGAFDVLPLSTDANGAELNAALAAMACTFTRAGSATVQTGPAIVVASGIGVDVPRVGDGGYGRGLVLEESRVNAITNARQMNAWAVGAAVSTVTNDYAVSPDGTTLVDRQQVASGNFGRYQNTYVTSGAARWTLSQWARRGVLGVASSQGMYFTSGAGAAFSGSKSTALADAWTRQSVTCASSIVSGSTLTVVPGEGRAIDTIAAAARDAVMDFCQLENGAFPTEAIVTTGAAATRAAERLRIANAGARFDIARRGGRYAIELRFIPKGSSTQYATAAFAYVADTGAPSYAVAYINAAGTPILQTATASATATTPMVWAAGQIVDVFFELGGGAPYLAYRVNGGARTVMAWGAGVLPALTSTTGSLDLMSNQGASFALSCWLQRARIWAPGRRPAWTA